MNKTLNPLVWPILAAPLAAVVYDHLHRNQQLEKIKHPVHFLRNRPAVFLYWKLYAHT